MRPTCSTTRDRPSGWGRNWMGRSSPRRTGWSFTFGDSPAAGTAIDSNRATANVLIGAGIIRYATSMVCNASVAACVGAALAAVAATLRRLKPPLLLLLITTFSFAQQPGGIAIANDAIPADQLEKMDRRELGDSWRADIAPRLRGAHELLEKYFSSKTTPERAAAVKDLL